MIKLLSGMPPGVLGLEAIDDVEEEDYRDVVVPAIDAAIAEHGKVRLVYVLGPEFDEYEKEAAWEDLKLGVRHPASFERIAIVTDARWAGPTIRLFSVLWPGQARTFPLADLEAALTAFEADALLSASSPDPSALTWTSDRYLGSEAPVVTLPSGWLMQLTSGGGCRGVEPPARTLSVSPTGDFTLSLGMAWWPVGTADAARVAGACGGGRPDQAPFVQRTTWAGVSYVTEGIVRTVEGGVVKTGHVRLGRFVTVGLGSMVGIGVDAGEKCQIGALSVVPKYSRLEAGAVYAGAPVKRLDRHAVAAS